MPYITSVAETASASIHRSKNISTKYDHKARVPSRIILHQSPNHGPFSHQQIVAFSNQVGSAWVTFFN